MNIHVTNYDSHDLTGFDVFICALGYEKRSIYVAQSIHQRVKRKFAFAFTQRHVLSYNSNKEWLVENQFEIIPYDEEKVREDLLSIYKTKSFTRVAVDISSMSRPMLAYIVYCLKEAGLSDCNAVFFYAPAEYIDSQVNSEPIAISEPVIPEFAGWSVHPEYLPAVVIGLGYEYDRAIGVIEYLEPESVWAFLPRGVDQRYDDSNDDANRELLDILPQSNIIKYEVNDPYDCIIKLESLVYGLTKKNRTILVPFGPKIFTLLSMIVSIIHYPNTTIWRVSGGQTELPVERIANGEIIGISIKLL